MICFVCLQGLALHTWVSCELCIRVHGIDTVGKLYICFIWFWNIVNIHRIQHVNVCLHVGLSRRFCSWQTSKLDQLVTIQHVAIINHNKSTCIFDRHGLTAMCHSSEDRPASICGQQCRRQSRWMIS
jgi:hypothetical protein